MVSVLPLYLTQSIPVIMLEGFTGKFVALKVSAYTTF
jgi:hypothetical protein